MKIKKVEKNGEEKKKKECEDKALPQSKRSVTPVPPSHHPNLTHLISLVFKPVFQHTLWHLLSASSLYALYETPIYHVSDQERLVLPYSDGLDTL